MLGARDHLWSMGTFGALMGFTPGGAVSAEDDALIATGTGALLRLDAAPRLLAFETISSDPLGWNHGVALCAPAERAAPSVNNRPLRWAGPDARAIAPGERHLPLLDLGLEQAGCRALLRLASEAEAEALCGQLYVDAAESLGHIAAAWVVETPLGRLERYHDGKGPPPLMRVGTQAGKGRVHAASTPVPPGWLPYAHVFPPHPARHAPGEPAAFDPARHAAFQALLERHGDADLWALKTRVMALLREGRFEDIRPGRHGAAVVRVALRQARHLLSGPLPREWLAAHDRPLQAYLAENGP